MRDSSDYIPQHRLGLGYLQDLVLLNFPAQELRFQGEALPAVSPNKEVHLVIAKHSVLANKSGKRMPMRF